MPLIGYCVLWEKEAGIVFEQLIMARLRWNRKRLYHR